MVFSFQSAADRRQPVRRRPRIYSLINAPGAPLRRALGDGRHRQRWCSGLVKLLESRGGSVRCNAEVRARSIVERRPRHRRARWPAARRISGRHRGVATPTRPGPTATCWRRRAPPHWTDRQHRAQARYSMSLFVWYFGTNRAVRRTCRTTRSCSGPRYKELLDDIFRPQACCADDFSLYLHRPDRHRPVAGAARLRHLLRAVAGAAPGQRHRLADQGRDAIAKRLPRS
ncbi:MAG: hypothetical protein MZV49_22645 [Rhodopseudomonas palustris]|nr:hypothetical protein [Rhodopseudomonas palustris]